jgi:hypothetical protein
MAADERGSTRMLDVIKDFYSVCDVMAGDPTGFYERVGPKCLRFLGRDDE